MTGVTRLAELEPEQLDALRSELAHRRGWSEPSRRQSTGWHEGWSASRLVAAGKPLADYGPAPVALELLDQLGDLVGGRLVFAWWARLDPGEYNGLDWHRDPEPFKGFVRLHVPVISDGTSEFHHEADDGPTIMVPGSVYSVGVLGLHAVTPPAHQPRLHLCADYSTHALEAAA